MSIPSDPVDIPYTPVFWKHFRDELMSLITSAAIALEDGQREPTLQRCQNLAGRTQAEIMVRFPHLAEKPPGDWAESARCIQVIFQALAERMRQVIALKTHLKSQEGKEST